MKIRDVLPERFREARIENVDADVFPMVIDCAQHLADVVKRRRGILLSGPPGVGKTYALAALTVEYMRRSRRPYPVFETAYRFIERYAPVVSTHVTVDTLREQPWTRTYEECFWLVLNDVGKDYRGGKLAEQGVYKFGRLLRERNEARLPVFITTNLPIKSETPGVQTFGGVYGESIASLLSEMVDAYTVNGPDRRRQE